MKELRGRVAVITGASSGIGAALAQRLAGAGMRVVIAARREAKLREIAADLRARGAEVIPVRADVAVRSDAERVIERAEAEFGAVDLLVLSAGVYDRQPSFDVDLRELERTMAINFWGPLYSIRRALPRMIERRSGHIVLISTFDAKKGLPQDAPYVASKAAISGFCDVLRQEVRPFGVRVTSVFPGRVDTPMIEHLAVPVISAKISPDRVARAVLRAVRRDRAEVFVPWMGLKALALAQYFSAGLADRLIHAFALDGREIATRKQTIHV